MLPEADRSARVHLLYSVFCSREFTGAHYARIVAFSTSSLFPKHSRSTPVQKDLF
jgi:hypothetical protein